MAPAAASIRSSSAAIRSGCSDDPAEQQQLDLDPATTPQGGGDEAAAPKSQQQQLECPRCRSTNTKFCYYNNYSTAQPRHFCRACRRYWTHGGTLRDVPVGGAPRRGGAGTKRRRLSSSAEPPLAAGAEDASFPADFSTTLFPFLSDGIFLPPPQLDFDQLGVAPSAFPWPSAAAAVPDFYYGTLAPWDDDVGGTLGDGGAWGGGDIVAGLELTWPPPPGH